MKRKTVSLCVIARDEEATIGMAIKSVLALVDEVIVVDTGSRDNTRIIAEGYGARVVDVPWEDDFSAVRNTALSEASCDWVLVLDADEYLQPVRPVEFQRLLHDPAAAGKLLFLGLYFVGFSFPLAVAMILAADGVIAGLRARPRLMRAVDWLFAGVFGAFAVKILATQGR